MIVESATLSLQPSAVTASGKGSICEITAGVLFHDIPTPSLPFLISSLSRSGSPLVLLGSLLLGSMQCVADFNPTGSGRRPALHGFATFRESLHILAVIHWRFTNQFHDFRSCAELHNHSLSVLFSLFFSFLVCSCCFHGSLWSD